MVVVAVEGCCHGALNDIYDAVPRKAELLIICGDFQAIRNHTDLRSMNVPLKYLQMGDFPDYYLGRKRAPLLTIFIGGNHESSLYLRELQYGGWVAPNIYYLGNFGIVWYKGLRICGVSGIWNSQTFDAALSRHAPNYTLPYNNSTIRSIYHVSPKSYLKWMLAGDCDIILSHDWPRWVWEHGDYKSLLRRKPFFRDDMKSGKLGSPLAGAILAHIRPRYWFSLHLHNRFVASVEHPQTVEPALTAAGSKNDDEIELDFDEPNEKSQEHEQKRKQGSPKTHFLALDKCLPRRRYLEVLEIESETNHPGAGSNELFYDARALAINKVVEAHIDAKKDDWLNLLPKRLMSPSQNRELLSEFEQLITREMAYLSGQDLKIPPNFEIVAPDVLAETVPLQYWPNGQTAEYCQKFGILLPVLDSV